MVSSCPIVVTDHDSRLLVVCTASVFVGIAPCVVHPTPTVFYRASSLPIAIFYSVYVTYALYTTVLYTRIRTALTPSISRPFVCLFDWVGDAHASGLNDRA